MSGDKIIRGLKQAVAHSEGKGGATERQVRVETNPNVKKIRTKLGVTQHEFALQFGFSLAAVRHWEQGSRMPEMSARVLLTLIDRDPDYVRRTLSLDDDSRIAVCG